MLACVKYVVIVYNFLFWLLGVGILGFWIYLYVDSHYYVNFENVSEMYGTPFFILMTVGAVMTVVGFMGCCGAVRESTCLLGMYIFFCVVMGVACGAAAWWANENREPVLQSIQKELSTVIQEKYTKGSRGFTEITVDKIQTEFQCCGVQGAGDWLRSRFVQGNKTVIRDIGVIGPDTFEVPASCCTLKNEECETSRTGVTLRTVKDGIHGLNTKGCITLLDEYIQNNWKLSIIIGGVLVLVQLFALFFTCCLCCALSSSRNK